MKKQDAYEKMMTALYKKIKEEVQKQEPEILSQEAQRMNDLRRSLKFTDTKKLKRIEELQIEAAAYTGKKLDKDGLKKKLMAGIQINLIKNSMNDSDKFESKENSPTLNIRKMVKGNYTEVQHKTKAQQLNFIQNLRK